MSMNQSCMAQAQWQGGIPSNAQMQKEWAPVTITPDTLRSLLEVAHQHMGLLEQETQRLGESLYPVRTAVPQGNGQKSENISGDPECLASLQVLIDKIRQQTENIRTLTAEVRI